MARQPNSSSDSKTPRTSTYRTTEQQQAAPSRGTGQEPDPRGVHRPGKAPGEFTDLGPVSIPVDAPRVT